MNLIKSVWNFIKKYWKYILLLLCILGIVFLILENKSLKREYDTNVVILTDSLYYYKNKSNELYDMQYTYITTEKELEKKNKELSDEIKKLKDNPLVVTIVKTEYKIDTVETYVSDIDYNALSNLCSYNWRYNNDWFGISGQSNFNFADTTGCTIVNDVLFKSELTLDIIENKNKDLEIIVKDANPYANITSINGAIISPEKIKSVSSRIKNRNSFGLGVQLGFGAGLYQQNVVLVPYLGLGISYNIITF